jgi:hypothetical protein
MFTTKYPVTAKNTKNYTDVGNPYNTKTVKKPSYMGKQFQTNPGKKGQTPSSYFNNFAYKPSEYQKALSYLKEQPRESRKLGFGSHDASKRGEFSNTLRTAQYREKLKTEAEMSRKNINNGGYQPDIPNDGETVEEMRQRLYNEKWSQNPNLYQTKVPFGLYDIGRTQVTDFNNKSSCEKFYDHLDAARSGLRRPGNYPTSYETYGNFATKQVSKPEFGAVATTKTFYDSGHLRV